MKNTGIYNGKMLPEFVFHASVKNYLFFELNVIFESDFIFLFKEFLETKNIVSITVKNLVPELFSFEKEVPVRNLENSFKDATCNETKQDYVAMGASFYMLVEQGIIFSNQDDETFCIFLDREMWVAILALKNVDDENYFRKLEPINFIQYFNLTFGDLPGYADYIEKLKFNWQLK
jgi:hypothetical protein